MLDDPVPVPPGGRGVRRTHGEPNAATDATAALHAAGLIHLAAGYTWPTPAAADAARVENVW